MKVVHQQRKACKNAIKLSLSGCDKAATQVHPSHQKAIMTGRTNLGVPISVNVTKALTPRQIIELRRRIRMAKRAMLQQQLQPGLPYQIHPQIQLQQQMHQMTKPNDNQRTVNHNKE
eukprot:TRINITY_DN15574_c0_g1_i1.p3 TRINITY_DN15574_c0_g1~~TRINITY_DN15574_c0_g1_i1.p3  ORF type:complete len:117 (-),score=17.91 TRINITY_DN15574_c0_g1_i1:214-564(-)